MKSETEIQKEIEKLEGSIKSGEQRSEEIQKQMKVLDMENTHIRLTMERMMGALTMARFMLGNKDKGENNLPIPTCHGRTQ